MIYSSIDRLIGQTPLVELSRLRERLGLGARLLVKLECFNPSGSAKDRAALWMIDDAEARGLLGPGSTIIEPTSGNTGIGLASVAVPRGYRVIIVMPETMSEERRLLMRAHGAELVLTPGPLGMKGAVDEASRLAASTPGAFIPSQFNNPANPRAHMESTGPELWEDTGGDLAAFVAGVGTGGTVSGAGRYLRSRSPAIFIAAVEPAASPLLSTGQAGPHRIQGIGANFVPKNYDESVVDEVLTVTDADAVAAARLMARAEGILAGISSGAALHAAIELARRPRFAGKPVAALLPDTGERYLSTPGFVE